MPAHQPVVCYLSHPQVRVEPDVPVPEWGLSDLGRSRTNALARSGWLRETARIVSSAETKAVETAEILASALGLTVEVRPGMHENDRSATGYLPAAEFEATADRFFAHPLLSVRGWERAIDAQARIVHAVEQTLAQPPGGDLLLVGHGAVGTLLYCHYAGLPISRRHDQPSGGGNYLTITHDRRVLHPWRPLEEPPDAEA